MNVKSIKKTPICEMNVVPYIDVMLVLLVIFMITTPLLNQGVNVDLPQAQAKPMATEAEPMIISVDPEGRYFLNVSLQPEQAITPENLAIQVAAHLQLAKKNNQPAPAIFIKGDKGVPYGKVVEAMALLQGAGIEHVGLMTQPNPQTS